MSTLSLFPEFDSTSNDTPLPLVVAKRWQFPLAFHIVEGKYMYAIQDWVRGLVGESDIRYVLSKLKQHKSLKEMWKSLPRLKYKATDGKTYPRDFGNAENLYLITQYLRLMSDRPMLEEIKQYLSKSGAFVDEVRLDPTTVLTSGAISPDEALDAAIQMYRDMGKDDKWIQMRIHSKIKRDEFIRALGDAVADVLNRRHYAIATNDIYKGLWGRTAARLKEQLGVSPNGSLRDRQPTMALHFQGIAEEAAAYRLRETEEISWSEARDIVRTIAEMVKPWAHQMSEHLRIDIATGYPKLSHG